jgi:hypothetical protein
VLPGFEEGLDVCPLGEFGLGMQECLKVVEFQPEGRRVEDDWFQDARHYLT